MPLGSVANVRQAMDCVTYRPPVENLSVEGFYRDWIGSGPGSEQAQALLHTQFHAVAKLDTDEAVVAAGW